jgi:hypothetical protein
LVVALNSPLLREITVSRGFPDVKKEKMKKKVVYVLQRSLAMAGVLGRLLEWHGCR